MQILSVMTKKRKKIFALICLSLTLTAALIVSSVFFFGQQKDILKYHHQDISCRFEKMEDIQKFAEAFHLKIGENPEKIQNIQIPSQFNAIYSDYNALQQKIGFDLLPYSGKECQLYQFSLQNYQEEKAASVNFIVYQNRIIGGDISEKIYQGKLLALDENQTIQ